MLTLALLGRLWRTARYRQLMRELLAGRPEADLHFEQQVCGPLAAAALGLLRLGELRQAAVPIAAELREHVLLCQRRDGGWGEADGRALLTALCVRGLASVEGARASPASIEARVGAAAERRFAIGQQPGVMSFGFNRDARLGRAIERGIEYLASAQQPGAGWGDGFVTPFVLLQLGRMQAFRRAVCVGDALAVRRLTCGESREARAVWLRVDMRCGRALRLAALQERPARAHVRTEPLFANVA